MAASARTRQREQSIQGVGSLLTACLQAGLPVASACSGRGACGRCLLSILQGRDALEGPTEREQSVLTRIQAGPGERLACQCNMPDPAVDLVVTAGYW